jgi:antitoxin component YwqK of YwqJK toxin-antitoxin module
MIKIKSLRNIPLCLIILLISNAVSAQTGNDPNGYNMLYHPNGQKSSEGSMRDGKPDGYWKTYNETGVLVSEGNRKDFELDSTWKFYDDSARIKMEINYLKGKKNGVRKTYKEDEVIEENFINDVKEGPTNTYFVDGTLKKTVPFKEGLEEGLAMEYAQDGRIITLIRYKSGFITDRELINRYDAANKKDGPWKYFYANGQVKREGTYRHGKEEGYFKEYDQNGNLITTSKFTEGVKQEDVAELVKLEVRKDYYPDGTVKIAATYNKEGQLEGVRREYAEDGTIEKSFIFKNGIMIGEGIVTEKGERDGMWKEYFDSGKLRGEGRYNKDAREGLWKFYHENGQLEQQGTYRNGKPDGEWIWYYASGELLREEAYFDGLQDGVMTEYDETGNIITKGQYIEGKENGEWYYKVALAEVIGTYSDGMRNGQWRSWDLPANPGRSKTLRFEGKFVEENPHGVHTYYWENGNRKEEGEYVMGRKEGNWVIYNADGSLYLVINYENGFERKYDGIKIEEGAGGQE